MNRRQKIIVSVTGITLISLFLIALTYGYYVTIIKDNSKDTSINLITDNLELVYGDDDGSIIGAGQLITPDTTFEPKTFSVENKGESTVEYSVVLDNVVITDLSTGKKSTDENSNVGFESNDFVYTLTCESGCNGVSTETTLPLYNNGILVSNSIDEGEKQTYSITITYKDTKVDQSADMNKSLSARINIMDPSTNNPYKSNTSTLAYNIINNAMNKTNGTIYSPTPLTTPAVEISGENERTLSMTTDNYGTSYYYRGNVEDNYVNFAGMCWRIVRIEGDGSVKIILAAQKKCSEIIDSDDTGTAFIGTGDFGYRSEINNNLVDYISSTTGMRSKLTEWLDNSKIDKTKLKQDNWCIGNMRDVYNVSGEIMGIASEIIASSANSPTYSYFRYSNYNRIYTANTPSLKCETTGTDGEVDTNYIGALTADEIIYAGGKADTSNQTYYLNNNATSNWWWTITLLWNGCEDADYVANVRGDGAVVDWANYGLGVNGSDDSYRPALTLKVGTTISAGVGTKENPYVVE